MEHMARIVKPGGHYLILDRNEKSPAARLFARMEGHVHGEVAFRSHLARLGFTVERARYEGIYLPPLPFTLNTLRKAITPSRKFTVGDFAPATALDALLFRMQPEPVRGLVFLSARKTV